MRENKLAIGVKGVKSDSKMALYCIMCNNCDVEDFMGQLTGLGCYVEGEKNKKESKY